MGLTDSILLFVVTTTLAAFLTWIAARTKARADERSLQASLSDATWKRSKEWLDRLEKKIEKLEAENARIIKKHEELWAENRLLQQENRDQQQLIKEVAEYIVQTDAWIASGAPPPPPTKPQRIAQHVEQIRQKYNRKPGPA